MAEQKRRVRRASTNSPTTPGGEPRAAASDELALQDIAAALWQLDRRLAHIEYLLECGEDCRADTDRETEAALAAASLAEPERISHDELLRQLAEE